MTYWEQRAVTEKLIAKRKAKKPRRPLEGTWRGKPASSLSAQEYWNMVMSKADHSQTSAVAQRAPVDRYAFFPSHTQ